MFIGIFCLFLYWNMIIDGLMFKLLGIFENLVDCRSVYVDWYGIFLFVYFLIIIWLFGGIIIFFCFVDFIIVNL